MSSLFLPSSWPYLAVVLLLALYLFADACRNRREKKQEEGAEDENSLLEEHLLDLQYLHNRIREEDFRRAMFEQHQAMLDLPDAGHELHKLGIAVEQLMTSRVLSVLPETSRDEVVAAMLSIRAHHILVCDDRDRLLGVISDRDLASREGDSAEVIMTREPMFVGPRTSTAHALALMLRHQISCLPVVDDREQLIGVLTTNNLLTALSCYLELSAMLCSSPVHGEGGPAEQRRARSLRRSAALGKRSARAVLSGMGGRSREGQPARAAGMSA